MYINLNIYKAKFMQFPFGLSGASLPPRIECLDKGAPIPFSQSASRVSIEIIITITSTKSTLTML